MRRRDTRLVFANLEGTRHRGVAFVLDGNEDIFPSPADVKRVDDYISGHNDPVTGQLVGKPLGPIVTTFALTPRPVDMTIRISPSNDETKMAVKKALVALFYNESKPAGSIIPSHINRAIAGVSGLVDFELISPTGISYAGAEELLTVGLSHGDDNNAAPAGFPATAAERSGLG